MAYPIDRKLVIAVSSSALFDLTESDRVFREEGSLAYKDFQEKNLDNVLAKGVAFPFVHRFLSIKHFGLNITRAGFMAGKSPYHYIDAFNASLFLSANEPDVIKAIEAGYPAGTVLPSEVQDDDGDELRIAFDFDGVIADDEAEAVYKDGDLPKFIDHEVGKSHLPHNPGPLAGLFTKLSFMQKLEDKALADDSSYQRIIRTAIVTARSAPTHERVITTLEEWGVSPNEVFFLGGMDKGRILKVMKPHIFFDDQKSHFKSAAGTIPMVHIPYGVANTIQIHTDGN
ncbi:MAG: 5'-nucleotidase [Gammaproteobacteria bacterium]|nr:5'-nucleotidase [Gammaproteobacteria bacterium]